MIILDKRELLQMIMGYRDRNRLFPAAQKLQVITNSGIVYPTILLDGQLGARWKKDGTKLLITPFGPLSQKQRNLITAQEKRFLPASRLRLPSRNDIPGQQTRLPALVIKRLS